MDRVTIMLQNKQLIEEIINTSEETKVKVHAAIIDGVTKRIVKNVTTNIDPIIKEVTAAAEDKIIKEYAEYNSNGWRKFYKLKQEHVEAINETVKRAWTEQIETTVKEYQTHIMKTYETKIKGALDEFDLKIKILTANLDDRIQKAVNQIIKQRFNN